MNVMASTVLVHPSIAQDGKLSSAENVS